jgi:hypothetical protein
MVLYLRDIQARCDAAARHGQPHKHATVINAVHLPTQPTCRPSPHEDIQHAGRQQLKWACIFLSHEPSSVWTHHATQPTECVMQVNPPKHSWDCSHVSVFSQDSSSRRGATRCPSTPHLLLALWRTQTCRRQPPHNCQKFHVPPRGMPPHHMRYAPHQTHMHTHHS